MRAALLSILFGSVTAVAAHAASMNCTSTPGLAVDADGAPNSYLVNGLGLSRTCDGVFAVVNGVVHTQKNDKAHWQDLCEQHWSDAVATNDYSGVKIVGFLADPKTGGPIVQGDRDPLPGKAFVTTTSLIIPGTPSQAQRHYVDASEIPYVVLSSSYASTRHLRTGDLVAVYRPKTGRLAYGVYGDCCSLGEASVRLHQDLGSDPLARSASGTQRASIGIPDRIVFVALTGAHTTPTLDASAWRAEIEAKGDRALHAIGGVQGVKTCAN